MNFTYEGNEVMAQTPVKNLRIVEILLHGESIDRGPTVLVTFTVKQAKVRCGRLIERQALLQAFSEAIAKIEKEKSIYVAN